jgi:hypothetical protein
VAAGGLILLTNSQTVLESLGASGSTVALVASVIAFVWVALIVWAVKQERASRAQVSDEELETAAV